MRHKNKVRKVVRIMIESKLYFTLSVRERYDLIKYMLDKFSYLL
jgi:hypothetical protein